MPTKVLAVTAVEQRAVEQNEARTLIVVVNTSGAETAYLSDENGMSLTEGIPIGPGMALELSKRLGYDTDKPWYIVGSGNLNARITEGFAEVSFPPPSSTPPSSPPERVQTI